MQKGSRRLGGLDEMIISLYAGIHRQNDLIDAGEPPLPLGHDHRARSCPLRAPVPVPPGFTAWRVKGTRGVTVLPAVLPHAPVRIRRAYSARILANLIGTCPLCGGTAWIDTNAPDPERNPAGWARLTITFGVQHAPGCWAAEFSEADKRFFDLRAVHQ